MKVRRFNQQRAEEERRKAAAASNPATREGHEEMARMFEARAAARASGKGGEG